MGPELATLRAAERPGSGPAPRLAMVKTLTAMLPPLGP